MGDIGPSFINPTYFGSGFHDLSLTLIDPIRAVFNARALAGVCWIIFLVFVVALFFGWASLDLARLTLSAMVFTIAGLASWMA